MSTSNRCPVCNKKANMLGIICKCGQTFCMEHRMPEMHKCTFDYKTQYQKNLMEKLTTSAKPKIIESRN